MMDFIFNDGGRSAAGFIGRTDDCVTRAVAITTGIPYQQIYDQINVLGKDERIGRRKKYKSSARSGVYKQTYKKLLASLGWHWVPTMSVGSGCRVHLQQNELPPGRLIVKVSKHLVAVIDGVIHDTSDPSRNGNRCVYGYFTFGGA